MDDKKNIFTQEQKGERERDNGVRVRGINEHATYAHVDSFYYDKRVEDDSL